MKYALATITLVVVLTMILGVSALSANAADTINRSLLVKPPEPATMPAGDPRRGAVVTLGLDKKQYYLGENILLRWRVANEGDQPFNVSIGGDYRGSYRALRFKIQAVDEQGRKMLDPYPSSMNFGGMMIMPTLKPGEDHKTDIQLMRYREFPRTGKYTIKVFHDLGWKSSPVKTLGPLKAPTVTITIRLVMPDKKQAQQVVDAMLAMPTESNRSSGQWGKPYADFNLISYPVYLPILNALAQKGNVRALDAIGAMPFPDATAALIGLARDKDPAIVAKALKMLWRRLPRDTKYPQQMRYLSQRAWTDKLKADATTLAWTLMNENDWDGITTGLEVLKSLGGKDDLPGLITLVDRVLTPMRDDVFAVRGRKWPATRAEELMPALEALIKRGAKPPVSTQTPGQAMAFLAGLKTNKKFRPKGWRKLAVNLIAHEKQLVREMALKCIPLPLDDAGVIAVAKAMKDKTTPVQWAACGLAEKAKSLALGQPATDVLKKSDNHWVLRSAFRAAGACGVDNDQRLELCVAKLGRGNDMNMLLLGLLIDGSIKHMGGTGSSAIRQWESITPGIRGAWMHFIASNRKALRGGKRFIIAKEPVIPEMFPPKFAFSRPGKTGWPPPRIKTQAAAALDYKVTRSYAFLKSSVVGRLNTWVKTRPKTAGELKKYATELVINLDSPEVVIKDERGRRSGLSSSFTWTVHRITPQGVLRLEAPVRLKLRALASQANLCREVFILQGEMVGGRGVYVDITTSEQGLQFHAGKGVADFADYKFPKNP
jgi:hypothetical protein